MASYGDDNNQLISSNLLVFWAFPLQALVIIYRLLQNLPSCVTRHLNGCDQHMTILRRLGPPLQWNVIVLDIGIGENILCNLGINSLKKVIFLMVMKSHSTTSVMNKFGKLLLEVKRG